MSTELESALATYSTSIHRIAGRSNGKARQGNAAKLQDTKILYQLETTNEFRNLVAVIATRFGKAEFHKRIGNLWETRVANWLRLSGFYEQLFTAEDKKTLNFVPQLIENFSAPTVETIYAPLEGLSFSKDIMDFGEFGIHHLAKIQLDEIFKQRVCTLFYPHAVLDSERLSEYWFIVCKRQMQSVGAPEFDLSFLYEVDLTFSRFPASLEHAFRRLILYPWMNHGEDPRQLLTSQQLNMSAGPFYFSIPFILTASNSYIETPQSAPDLSILTMEPRFDPESGEEIEPSRWVGWDEDFDSTEDFFAFITRVDQMLHEVGRGHREWRFLETALSFVEKGFLQLGPNPDQLLSHITAIEALLGQKTDTGLTQLLKRRVGRILGKTTEEQKLARKAFDSLYALRSDIVHGNPDLGGRKVYLGHLGQAREMARAITVWMLEYLVHIKQAIRGAAELPSRDTVMSAIDIDEKSRGHAATVLSSLPKQFPSIDAWHGGEIKAS